MRILWLLTILLIIPIVSSIECQRVTYTDDIPCTIYSAWKPSSGCSENLAIYYTNGTPIYNTTWSEGNPFCNATFNISTIGTYIYESDIDDGIVVVRRTDNMNIIVAWQIFMIIVFIAMGIPHRAGFIKFTAWGMAVLELLFTMWIIYIDHLNESIDTLMYVNTIAVLIIAGGIGFVTTFVIMTKLMGVTEDKKVEDDGYTKWMYK